MIAYVTIPSFNSFFSTMPHFRTLRDIRSLGYTSCMSSRWSSPLRLAPPTFPTAYFSPYLHTVFLRARCGYFSDINCQIFVFPENIIDFGEKRRKPRYSLRAFLFTLENSVHFTRFGEVREFSESMRFRETKVRAWALNPSTCQWRKLLGSDEDPPI